MKVRFGFVTNSSSSSFIIGKVEEKKLSLDDVFSLIKDFYKEWIKKSEEFVNYVNEKHQQNNKYPYYEDGRLVFDKSQPLEKRWDIEKQLEREANFSHYDVYHRENIDFLQCETYEEYKEFAQKKIQEAKAKKERTDALVPFTIDYLNNPNPVMLHYGVYPECYEDDDKESYTYSEILCWYCPYADRAEEVCTEDICKNCEDREYCGGEEAREALSSNTNLSLTERLGQICVYSECGYIPDYVVEQLGEIAHLWCNHMG